MNITYEQTNISSLAVLRKMQRMALFYFIFLPGSQEHGTLMLIQPRIQYLHLLPSRLCGATYERDVPFRCSFAMLFLILEKIHLGCRKVLRPSIKGLKMINSGWAGY